MEFLSAAEGVACPRCKGELHARGLGHGSIVECARCGGIWLGHEDFVRICTQAEQENLVEKFHLAPPALPASATSHLAYVPCVVCSELMNRRNYATASGVIIDVCREHGVWLDHGEIDKILEFIRAGGLERARQRDIERLEDQRRRLRAEQAAANASFGAGGLRGEELLIGARGRGRSAALEGFLSWLF